MVKNKDYHALWKGRYDWEEMTRRPQPVFTDEVRWTSMRYQERQRRKEVNEFVNSVQWRRMPIEQQPAFFSQRREDEWICKYTVKMKDDLDERHKR